METLPDYLLQSSTYAQWLLTQGQRAACAEILAARYEKAVRAGALQTHVETRALQALAATAHNEALSFLNEALTLAEPEGYARIFLDEGEALRLLIVDFRFWIEAHILDAARRTRLLNYVDRLLIGVAPAVQEPPASIQNRQSPFQNLVEPLSQRELEILRLIADGLTNQEIADRLVLSLPTVKWHTGNLYGKLGVNSRTQAAARARSSTISRLRAISTCHTLPPSFSEATQKSRLHLAPGHCANGTGRPSIPDSSDRFSRT